MGEDDGAAATPILVIDLSGIFGPYSTHCPISSAGGLSLMIRFFCRRTRDIVGSSASARVEMTPEINTSRRDAHPPGPVHANDLNTRLSFD
jgi:hypothetical protein